MNIVIIRPNTSDFGKIGTYNVQEVGLAKSLIKKGHNVTVLFTHRNVKEITRDESYNFVYYLPHKTIGLHGIFRLKFLSYFKPEYLIMFADNQFWAKNVIHWCKKNKIKCINYFGGVLSNNPGWLHQVYTRAILLRNRSSYKYSMNIAKTLSVKKEMEQNGIHCNKIVNIGLDTSLLKTQISNDLTIREEFLYTKSDKIILFIGRLVEYKKPILACEILKKIRAKDTSYKLIIIGSGPLEKKLENYIKENDLQNVVNYVGRVDYNEIHKYLIICDCLINLSSIEIFGMTILEGMYYGKAVIAHNAPGPNDIIESGVNGYLLNSYELTKWIDTIDKAIKNKTLLGKNSKKSVEEKFTWNAVCHEFLDQ